MQDKLRDSLYKDMLNSEASQADKDKIMKDLDDALLLHKKAREKARARQREILENAILKRQLNAVLEHKVLDKPDEAELLAHVRQVPSIIEQESKISEMESDFVSEVDLINQDFLKSKVWVKNANEIVQIIYTLYKFLYVLVAFIIRII